jgi:hypothetical protein
MRESPLRHGLRRFERILSEPARFDELTDVALDQRQTAHRITALEVRPSVREHLHCIAQHAAREAVLARAHGIAGVQQVHAADRFGLFERVELQVGELVEHGALVLADSESIRCIRRRLE